MSRRFNIGCKNLRNFTNKKNFSSPETVSAAPLFQPGFIFLAAGFAFSVSKLLKLSV
jgi:hypothetical protein